MQDALIDPAAACSVECDSVGEQWMCHAASVQRAGEKKILQLWLPSSSSEFLLKSSWYSRRIPPWGCNYTFWLICQSDGP